MARLKYVNRNLIGSKSMSFADNLDDQAEPNGDIQPLIKLSICGMSCFTHGVI